MGRLKYWILQPVEFISSLVNENSYFCTSYVLNTRPLLIQVVKIKILVPCSFLVLHITTTSSMIFYRACIQRRFAFPWNLFREIINRKPFCVVYLMMFFSTHPWEKWRWWHFRHPLCGWSAWRRQFWRSFPDKEEESDQWTSDCGHTVFRLYLHEPPRLLFSYLDSDSWA